MVCVYEKSSCFWIYIGFVREWSTVGNKDHSIIMCHLDDGRDELEWNGVEWFYGT